MNVHLINKWNGLVSRLKLALLTRFRQVQVECNICNWEGPYFLNTGWHKGVKCPKCKSQVRQRLFWATVNLMEDFSLQTLFVGKRILHFAPEESIFKRLNKLSSDYKTADLMSEGVEYSRIDFNIDLSKMTPIEDDSVDCFLAFDVLEHVPDDIRALREIKRVLSPSGVAFLMIPQDDHLKVTIEDPTITNRDKRIELFGAPDHVRIYGNDFEQRLKSIGFSVEVVDDKSFDHSKVARYVLSPPMTSTKKFATNNRRLYIVSV